MSENGAGTFQFGRAFAGWGWLLRRDLTRIGPVVLAWIGVGVILLLVDQSIGWSAQADWLSTTMLADPLFAGLLYVIGLSDDDASVSAAFGIAINRYLALFLLTVLSTLGIIAGLFLLILPGIALAVLWSAAFPILVAERANPIEALGTSFSRLKSRFWPVFGLLAVYTFGILFLAAIFGIYDVVDPASIPLSRHILDSFVTAISATLGVYLNVAIYRELGFTSGPDVNVFD
jgi:hypothetical protein